MSNPTQRTLASLWESYDAAVVKLRSGELSQRITFYSGAAALANLILSPNADPGAVLQELAEFHAELRARLISIDNPGDVH